MATVLAIDTSSEVCSVAVLHQGEAVSRKQHQSRQHAQSVLPLCSNLLSEFGLSIQYVDCIAFGQGPGSFTGLRVACSIAQGLAMGLDCPVVAVSSLQTLAQTAAHEHKQQRVFVAQDARMGEIYMGHFIMKGKLMQVVDEERLCSPAAILAKPGPWFGVGSGWSVYAEQMVATFGDDLSIDKTLTIDAQYLATIAHEKFIREGGMSAQNASPVYLRNQVTG